MSVLAHPTVANLVDKALMEAERMGEEDGRAAARSERAGNGVQRPSGVYRGHGSFGFAERLVGDKLDCLGRDKQLVINYLAGFAPMRYNLGWRMGEYRETINPTAPEHSDSPRLDY